MTDDATIHARINDLVAEEHRPRSDSGLDDSARARLSDLEVQLDRAWDLLRQRDAKQAAGENVEGAQERSAAEVEGSQQ